MQGKSATKNVLAAILRVERTRKRGVALNEKS